MRALKLVLIGFRNNRKKILAFLIPVLILEVFSVYLLYHLNSTYGNLYQAITDYKANEIWKNIGIFSGLAMILVGVEGYLGFFINRLAFEMRTGLTHHCLLNVSDKFSKTVPLYAQRVQEDLSKFSTNICDLSVALLRAGMKLPVFLWVIVGLTKWYIALAVVIAVIVATVTTKLAASRLVPLQAVQEGNEATFRLFLFMDHFTQISRQFTQINKKLKLLSFVQSGAQQFFVLLPFVILMPLYIAKVITVKGFFQSVNALAKIIQSLLVIIDNRQLIVQIESCLLRLEFLQNKDKG